MIGGIDTVDALAAQVLRSNTINNTVRSIGASYVDNSVTPVWKYIQSDKRRAFIANMSDTIWKKSSLSKLFQRLKPSRHPSSSSFCGRIFVWIPSLSIRQLRRSPSSFQLLKRKRRIGPRILMLVSCLPKVSVPCRRRPRKCSSVIGNALASFTHHQQLRYGPLPSRAWVDPSNLLIKPI